ALLPDNGPDDRPRLRSGHRPAQEHQAAGRPAAGDRLHGRPGGDAKRLEEETREAGYLSPFTMNLRAASRRASGTLRSTATIFMSRSVIRGRSCIERAGRKST